MGRAMGNNLMNLRETKIYQEVLSDMGVTLEDVEEYETDAGLGNGGLGRLAACFLDSLTNLEPVSYTHLDVYKRQGFKHKPQYGNDSRFGNNRKVR